MVNIRTSMSHSELDFNFFVNNSPLYYYLLLLLLQYISFTYSLYILLTALLPGHLLPQSFLPPLPLLL